MTYLLVEHNVSHYDHFESMFRGDEARRKRAGSRQGLVLRSAAEPERVFVLLEWDDSAEAEEFSGSYELRESVQWGGDPAPPRVMVLEESLRTDA